MSRVETTLGYIPLTDAALPILALELGFAAEEGVELTLVREPSWSNIRDKVAMGVYPAAHMLSPLAIALTAGVGPHHAPVVAPILLGTNGNTLTATPALAKRLRAKGAVFGDAVSTGTALAQVERLRVGVPFPHSMHRELVRFLIERSGGDADRVSFLTAPPRILPEVLAADEVDAFMVGEPWGSTSVDSGAGEVLLTGAQIWAGAPEKVLALDAGWVERHEEGALALVRALYRAALWAAGRESAASVAEILALPRYLDTSAEVIERALRGQVLAQSGGVPVEAPGLLRLDAPGALYPWISGAEWIADRAARGWGIGRVEAQAAARATFRPDLLHAALAPLEGALPRPMAKVEGRLAAGDAVPGTRGPVLAGPDLFFDGSVFEPAD